MNFSYRARKIDFFYLKYQFCRTPRPVQSHTSTSAYDVTIPCVDIFYATIFVYLKIKFQTIPSETNAKRLPLPAMSPDSVSLMKHELKWGEQRFWEMEKDVLSKMYARVLSLRN